jgi:hypothetical protein
MKEPMHKFVRDLKNDRQFFACKPHRNRVFSEHCSYFWKNVTCKKCLKEKK